MCLKVKRIEGSKVKVLTFYCWNRVKCVAMNVLFQAHFGFPGDGVVDHRQYFIYRR